ncbi:riboflavin synthase domain-like protein [Schizopora paradoxa]|uniref:NADPH-dependent diflavin oxidoreductase 1 n=1 Tax=Schizopora paradoxa TaxID=27342 RepID=A0A0H2RZ48_9AGAM|nr:riboflavin synthase domain-like protein [Schizopora paradoxa]
MDTFTSSEDLEQEPPYDLLIVYATETGNALDVAEQIGREALRRRRRIRLVSADSYPLENLVNESLVVFVVSTTGNGIEPRSMTGLWNMLLRSDLPTDLFDSLEYAVFGLGDSSYDTFCWAAKKLSRRLNALGALEILARGEADEKDSRGIDGALDRWIPGIFEALDDVLPPLEATQFASEIELPPPRIKVLEDTDRTSTEPSEEERGVYIATTVSNERMTAADWNQDVRLIEFTLDRPSRYSPGDVAVIYPQNTDEDVSLLLETLHWPDAIADQVFEFIERDGLPLSSSLPKRTTPRNLFTKYLDICAVPRRSFFRMIRHFAKNKVHKEKLFHLSSDTDEGIEDLYEYVTRTRRTILEVLQEFEGLEIPLEYILDVFPTMRPRQFSIASCSKPNSKALQLCVAIVNFKTKMRVPRRGVCTRYLASLRPGDELRIDIEKGYIKAPDDPTTPIICVGPGTGVAPMRALIGDRVFDGSRENTLYFGCRSATKDSHFAAEWDEIVKAQQLVYRPAFSRDKQTSQEISNETENDAANTGRTYVQHLIREDSKRIWELVGERGAWVYISGSSNHMPKAVKAAIEASARDAGGLTEDEARNFMKRLVDEGRLYEECWS